MANTLSHKNMRSNTLLTIVESVREGGAMSKKDIQEHTGLSWGSSSEGVNLLVREGLMHAFKVGNVSSLAGRKLTKYRFTNEKYLVCGIEIQGESMNCSLANFGMKEIARESFEISTPLSKSNFFKSILYTFNSFLETNGVSREQLLSVTVSLTGAVDKTNEKLVYSPRYPHIADLDFRALKNMLSPVRYFFVEHDIKGQTSSIIHKYDWKEDNFVFLHFGEGVGMSIYNKGFESGFNGFAGEIGHLPFRAQLNKVRKCSCGKTNCYETLLSKTGVASLIEDFGGGTAGAGGPGTKPCSQVIDLVAEVVSELIVTVSNIIDPQAVFYGGEAIESFITEIDPLITRSVRQNAWQGGPGIIRSYSAADINCAYGAILNSGNLITEQYITNHII